MLSMQRWMFNELLIENLPKNTTHKSNILPFRTNLWTKWNNKMVMRLVLLNQLPFLDYQVHKEELIDKTNISLESLM